MRYGENRLKEREALEANPWEYVNEATGALADSWHVQQILPEAIQQCRLVLSVGSVSAFMERWTPELSVSEVKLLKTHREVAIFIASTVLVAELSRAGVIRPSPTEQVALSGLLIILLKNILPDWEDS